MDILPQGQTINQHIYKGFFSMFHAINLRKKMRFLEKKLLVLYHDNTPAHNALSICEFLAKNNIIVLDQLPHLSDLAHCNFFFFPKLKKITWGMHFENVGCSKKALSSLIKIPPKCMEAWESASKLNETTLKAKSCSFPSMLIIKILCLQSQ